MGPAYHFRGSHVLGGSLELPLITLPETNIAHENPHLSW